MTIGRYKLRLLSFRNGDTQWKAKIHDLNNKSYPFRAFPAKDAKHGKVIALQLAGVYAGQQPAEVVWKKIPTMANYN